MQPVSQSTKPRFSHAVSQLLAMATEERGEFDAASKTNFPEISYSQPLFGGDPNAPWNWSAQVRVFSHALGGLTQLYVTLISQAEHGLVHYNQALLPGGRPLHLDHITSDTINPDSGAMRRRWMEAVAVELDVETLAAHVYEPLRIQISRPDEGRSFVVEVPSHYVAAVLYRLQPQDYELEEAPPVPVPTQQMNPEQQEVVRQLKKFAWVGVVGTVIGFFVDAPLGGLSLGFFAYSVTFAIAQKLHERRVRQHRHPLRSACK
jgi:hypothetical protein